MRFYAHANIFYQLFSRLQGYYSKIRAFFVSRVLIPSHMYFKAVAATIVKVTVTADNKSVYKGVDGI
jgi:hypothetical protein